MASKRKSTIPCMIPVKTMHTQDDREQEEGLPDCASSRPVIFHAGEDSCGQGSQEPSEAASSDKGNTQREGGTYTCRPCGFESHDLNLFLDHVYNVHADFRAEPSFYCLDCGVSAAKFEGLALHNAHAHPSTVNTTLQVKKRDRRITVEQSLVVNEGSKESEISITKTPIMKMLKGKSEPKRIVVSHGVDELDTINSKEAEKIELPAVTHVPTIVHNGAATKPALPTALQVVNGSGTLPVLKTAITQVVSVVQNRTLHQQSATMTASSSASSSSSSSTTSSRNLPKVMIPLSSIPTYDAAMDNSSFLKTSFSKFPYPTKAELCYLTVVTKYPEEQIKIWFTAQRLKQGISWSPEEIEDARRKMFNTIIQTAPPVPQQPQPRQTHHGPAQHTITVLPASLGHNSIPHILQGSLVGQGGVIVTQPLVANGLQVSSAPVALAVTPKPQMAAKPLMQARPTAALVADKGVSMVVGTVESSSSGGSSVIISTNSSISSNSSSSSSNSSSNSISTTSSSTTSSSMTTPSGSSSSSTSSSTTSTSSSTSSTTCSTSITPSSTISHTSVINVSSGSSSNSNHGNKGGEANSSSSSSNGTTSTGNGGGDANKGSTDDVVGVSGDEKTADALPPVLNMTHSSRTLPSSFLDPSFYKNKKSQEQLSALKQSFVRCQFPNQEEVERLTKITGLTVREVRKWFSDRRYHYRNLKGARSSTGGLFSGNSLLDFADSPASAEISKSSQSSQSTVQQHHHQTSPPAPSRRVSRQQTPDFTAIRYKERDPQQIRALEASFLQNPTPPVEEVDRLRAETKMTRREIDGWFSERRKKAAAEKKKEEFEKAEKEEEDDNLMEEDTIVKDGKDGPSQGTSTQQQNKEDKQKEDTPGSEPKVNPIKINLKMLKVTESNGKPEAEASPPTQAESPKVPHLSPSTRGKKTPDQLHLLKQVFARTQWPSSPQYEELIARTGLPRPEVVRWFGDSRYVYKNGQLKWLESYQQMAEEEDYKRGDTEVLKEHLNTHGKLEEEHVKGLVEASRLDEDLVRRWFATRSGLLPDDKAEEMTDVEQATEQNQEPHGEGVTSPQITEAQSTSTKEGTD
ncbi:zinc fingers and homeoboxes protein 3 isoform X2 [Brienomyrus brachyistius]|uniref:zinc fingers and homeoboxes protein 3 isoform X2 n=1 Tax=Brienomyrus brachyistius TaxID=42636 RepID=UPI0020B2F34C|nr:zinc fingers and homeoboxes protein 3 isoform X2 [Brienomyrus brachyistius]